MEKRSSKKLVNNNNDKEQKINTKKEIKEQTLTKEKVKIFRYSEDDSTNRRLNAEERDIVKRIEQIKMLEESKEEDMSNGPYIGKYQILRIIGEGGFGRVYKAKDKSGKIYALKEISASAI